MSIPGNANPLLLASAAEAAAAGQIDRSLRFNSADSAYLSKTFGSAGNRKKWTVSFWIKNCIGASQGHIFGARSGSEFGVVVLSSGGYLRLEIGNGTAGNQQNITAPGKLRDPSSWYHIVFSYDTTGTVVADMVKIYINGERVTTSISGNSNLQQNYETRLNNNVLHVWNQNTGFNNYGDFYLADCHFIDGLALDPTSFGAFDDNGVWQAAAYSGTYGTNGFHLDFSDATSTTTIAEDSSGNNNDWTANNISVTAGSGNDSMFDSPTNGTQSDTGAGGEVSGNYCTLNPLANGDRSTISNGNLEISAATSGDKKEYYSTIGMTSGKWYAEFTLTGTKCLAGISNAFDFSAYFGSQSSQYAYDGSGNTYNGGTATAYGDTLTTGDVLGIAFDADGGNLYFYKNGVAQNSGTAAYTGLTSGPYFFGGGENGATGHWNFGQRVFAYSGPSNYKALCTTNLPTPTIADGSDYFEAKLFTGTGSSNAVTGLEFSPDWVWIKDRTTANSHNVSDSVRGTNKSLFTNATNAETSGSPNPFLSSFDSNGFTVGGNPDVNTNGNSYVAWTWDAGSSTVSNTDGSVTSSVRANSSAGFSIVKYSLSGSSAETIGHGLNSSLGLLITKATGTTNGWAIWHSAFSDTQGIAFTTGAVGTQTWWDQSNMTNSVFAHKAGTTSSQGGDIIAYCFAPVAGYSAMGSWTAASTPIFIYTGFRPAFVLGKSSTTTNNWWIRDNKRLNEHNPTTYTLFPDSTLAERDDFFDEIDFVSNGFVIRASGTSNFTNTGTMIYAAFAENPFQANGGLAR